MIVKDTKHNNSNSIVRSAASWLLNSGIQNTGKDKRINGGFNAWYDDSLETYPFVYPEITGYGITILLYLNKMRRENTLKKAECAANWLINYAMHKKGGVGARCRYDFKSPFSYDPSHEDLLYSFDTGMFLFGLVNLYEFSRKQNYLDMAEKIAKSLIGLQKPDGSFYAAYNIKSDELQDNPEKWSTQSGSFHAKLALGLLKLHEITGEVTYKDSAYKICRYALERQEKNGRFVTSRRDNSTHAHPHCYSAEGLLFAGLYLDSKYFISGAVKATRWLFDNQQENGGIFSFFADGKFSPYERSDVLAQTLRLGSILTGMGILENKYKNNMARLFNRLKTFQSKDKTKQRNGGFSYGFELDGKRKKDVNAWCTMFALQAIMMYQQMLKNKSPINMGLFV